MVSPHIDMAAQVAQAADHHLDNIARIKANIEGVLVSTFNHPTYPPPSDYLYRLGFYFDLLYGDKISREEAEEIADCFREVDADRPNSNCWQVSVMGGPKTGLLLHFY